MEGSICWTQTGWLDRKTTTVYILSSEDPLQTQRHIQTKAEGMEIKRSSKTHIRGTRLQKKNWRLLWCFSGQEITSQCRGHRFDPWSRKIPHALRASPRPTATILPPLKAIPTVIAHHHIHSHTFLFFNICTQDNPTCMSTLYHTYIYTNFEFLLNYPIYHHSLFLASFKLDTVFSTNI